MSCECCDEMPVVKVGEKVPDFTIPTYEPTRGDFGEYSLSRTLEAKRWAILFFYPGDFTFVCATEFAALAEQQERFAQLGADLVTISLDSKFVHLAWCREEVGLKHAKYTMGADRNANVARMFGVFDEANGEAMRGTFIINPEGILVSQEVNFENVGRNIDELMRKFKAHLYVSKNSGQVCPSKWKDEGDVTLKPGAKLVGKVFKPDGSYGG